MTTLITGLEAITETIKCCIKCENVENGLLSDVEEIITVYNNEDGIEEPAVWIVQHPTIADEKVDLSQKLKLVSTFEFVCIEYDNDAETAERKSQNLATRVALSVLKNYKTMQTRLGYGRTISRIEFNTFRPVGEIQVVGKAEKVPVSGIVLDVIHYVDWNNCCKKIEAAQEAAQDLEPNDNDDNDNEIEEK